MWIGNAAVLSVLAPLLAHALLPPVRFNQFMLQRLEVRYGLVDFEMMVDGLRSAHGSGLRSLWPKRERRPPVFTDPKAVFRYVFDWTPPFAQVYPTEGYYYFETRFGERTVSGSIRVADLDIGLLSFAYFDRRTLESHWTVIDELDGLAIEKHSDYGYSVSFNGRTVRFKLTDIGERPPTRLPLHPTEDFVGQVYDESGIRFFLLFNREMESFYYVLNDEKGTTDHLTPAGGPFLIGRRTGFLFYDDDDATFDRRILVGVDAAEVLTNTFLDGPPDQVPFRARIRERVYRAYPSYRLGEGIDDTGVVEGRGEWARVAIAPLNVYTSVPGLVAALREIVDTTAPGPGRWVALTREHWNTEQWLDEVRSRLEAEGKSFRPPAWARPRCASSGPAASAGNATVDRPAGHDDGC